MCYYKNCRRKWRKTPIRFSQFPRKNIELPNESQTGSKLWSNFQKHPLIWHLRCFTNAAHRETNYDNKMVVWMFVPKEKANEWKRLGMFVNAFALCRHLCLPPCSILMLVKCQHKYTVNASFRKLYMTWFLWDLILQSAKLWCPGVCIIPRQQTASTTTYYKPFLQPYTAPRRGQRQSDCNYLRRMWVEIYTVKNL